MGVSQANDRLLARRVARGDRAALAPDCPRPTWAMLYGGARWSRDCGCDSCAERREAYHTVSAHLAASDGQSAPPRRAATAPDCPTPTAQMLYGGARWSRDCGCPSCTERRGDWRASISARPRDVDEMAVERAVFGHALPALNKAERMAATARLTRDGQSARQIAERLRVDVRSIHRYRRESAA